MPTPSGIPFKRVQYCRIRGGWWGGFTIENTSVSVFTKLSVAQGPLAQKGPQGTVVQVGRPRSFSFFTVTLTERTWYTDSLPSPDPSYVPLRLPVSSTRLRVGGLGSKGLSIHLFRLGVGLVRSGTEKSNHWVIGGPSSWSMLGIILPLSSSARHNPLWGGSSDSCLSSVKRSLVLLRRRRV